MAEPSNVDPAHNRDWIEDIGRIKLNDPSKYDSFGCRADMNGDGLLTFENFDAFVAAFEAGC